MTITFFRTARFMFTYSQQLQRKEFTRFTPYPLTSVSEPKGEYEMLCLTLNDKNEIWIGSVRIILTEGKTAKIGIEADRNIPINRHPRNSKSKDALKTYAEILKEGRINAQKTRPDTKANSPSD